MKLTKEIKEFFATFGKEGGSKKSEKKAIAARKNGKKGGRPKKGAKKAI